MLSAVLIYLVFLPKIIVFIMTNSREGVRVGCKILGL